MAYVSLPRRLVTLLMMSTVIVSCSAEGVLPPADVDGGTRVGSIQSSRTKAYSAPQAPVSQHVQQPPVQTDVYSDAGAGYEQPFPSVGAPPTTLEAQHQRLAATPQYDASAMAEGSEGVNMDSGLGVEPVRGLAEEQDSEIAEGNASQLVVDGIGTDNPSLVAPRQQRAEWGGQSQMQAPSDMATPQMATPQRAAPPRRQPVEEVAMLMPQNPMQQNRTSAPPGMMPSSEISCRSELRRLGVAFRDVARIADGPTCGIDYPIELSGLASGVAVKPAVKLNCQVTLAFAKWVKFELVPSSRFRYLSGVGRITPMGGYSCRKMNSRSSNPWSEHAKGNAIDIGTITLKNGKEIDVRKKGLFAFREKGLLKAVRTDSCKYFSTVLGPGSDPNHWNHFHFDLRTRKTGYRHCD